MEGPNTRDDQFKFSKHARVRQKQRNITDDSVSTAMESGQQVNCKDTQIYTNQNIKVVIAKDSGTVITVNKNTRNTRFQLSERTKQKEKSLLYKANVRNNDHAMCELAELYLNGELGEKDVSKAYSFYEKAAKKGNSHAMCMISQIYESGEFGEPDQELADRWLKKAADKKNMYALAVMGQRLLLKYLEKYPVDSKVFKPSAPQNEIFYYLNMAADKSSTRAIWQLGQIYEYGLLGKKNLPKAQELYIKAAKTGSPSSLDSLYEMSLGGSLSATELEDILDHLSTFLVRTSIGIGFEIGEKQLRGNLGYNPLRGFKMIEQAAFKEHEEAIETLAQCYRDGVGCDVNLKLAQYWFMKLFELYDISAKAGNIFSIWKLGKLYLNGNVGEIDLTKAELCFKEAIEKSSNPICIYELGKLYWEGRLGDKPINSGLQLINQAINIWKLKAAQGDKTVYDNLGRAYYLINSFKNCVYWLSQSSDGDIEARLFLASIYLNDSLPEQNIPLGLKILESIILEHNVTVTEAFIAADFTVNDETLQWLEDVADGVKQPMPEKNSKRYEFQKAIITILAEIYEKGEQGEIDYTTACKYYYKLFIEFESVEAGNKLVALYNDQHLPSEYYDTAKDWASQMPALIETDKIDLDNFLQCVWLLGKIYQKSNLLSYDIKEATKWLYLSLYFTRNTLEIKEIEHDLTSLPELDYQQKEHIVCELSQMTSNIKTTSSSYSKYKVMSRILGDIFYDNKIINQNIDKAIYWYTESAIKNNSRASLALARIYQHDKKDMDASVKWYKSSIKQGNTDALKSLKSIAGELKSDELSSFLSGYNHVSLVEESELINVKPLKNLQSYPKTTQEMYELGKYCLNLEDNQDTNVLNAAFWFREAMMRQNIDAAVELYSMYKSGILGINLIPVADNLYTDILNTCLKQLKDTLKKGTILLNQNGSPILSLLKSISTVLKIGTSPNELNEKIEKLINQTNILSTKLLKDIVSDLVQLIKLKYCSNNVECTISDGLDKISLEEGKTDSNACEFDRVAL